MPNDPFDLTAKPAFDRAREQDEHTRWELSKQASPKAMHEIYSLHFDKQLEQNEMNQSREASREDDLAKMKDKLREDHACDLEFLPPRVTKERLTEPKVTELAERGLEVQHKEQDAALEKAYAEKMDYILAREGIWPKQEYQYSSQDKTHEQFNERSEPMPRSQDSGGRER